jgi:site-specific DNA-cytosine methylase
MPRADEHTIGVRSVRVLIACEESGTVREEFRKRGHDAWSCDLKDTRIPGQHIKIDALRVAYHGADIKLSSPWDLMIAHPPCTYLSVAGARWKYEKPGWAEKQEAALAFVQALLDAPIKRIALEQPVSIVSTRIRKPDQYIQPWQFGHGETKKTCLWLKNLPLLVPTNVVEGREQRIWKMGPSPTRRRDRSVTYEGIAKAMAEQWG